MFVPFPATPRLWFSGRMTAYQAVDPDSISGSRTYLFILNKYGYKSVVDYVTSNHTTRVRFPIPVYPSLMIAIWLFEAGSLLPS